jgi:hypothetical protein
MFVVECAAGTVCGTSVHMPLLAELVSCGDGFCYTHGAPAGALPPRQPPIPPITAKNRIQLLRNSQQLDAFLRAGDRQILEHAGSISADEAKRKAELEFDQFDRQRRQLGDAQADAQFPQEVENLAKQAKQMKPPNGKK